MPKSAKYLLIGSTEAYSGKSATILGLGHHLQQRGLEIAYSKPLGTYASGEAGDGIDEDVRFLAKTLNIPEQRLRSPLVFLNEETALARLQEQNQTNYSQVLAQSLQVPGADIVLIEGPGTLDEGSLIGLSLLEIAEVANASILLVSNFRSILVIETLLMARQRLGNRLVGVLLNEIPPTKLETTQKIIRPFLESKGIPVLGMLAKSDLLRSVSVGELARRLNAEVICRPDRLDLMVESLKIGAMNVISALKYFSEGKNQAVVTGGDRTDIQMAALETSTQCLILTGHIPPAPEVISRAEEVEIPILSVDLDTISTVEIIEDTLGQVRIQEPIKVEYIRQMIAEHFEIDRLLAKLGLQPAVVAV